MANYIDGFAFPISRDRLGDYQRLADGVAEIWKEHGALDYREFSGDDMKLQGTLAFTDLMEATEEEVIVFGWVEFESREARDQANVKVAADQRIPDLMALSDSGFNPERMVYGGFSLLTGV